jgi:hypothetical protein
MPRPRALATASIVVFFGFAACGGRTERGGAPASERAGAMQWSVRIGSQGGFTGGGSGHVVHADGRVESWSQITPQDALEHEAVGHADPGRLAAVERTLMAPQLTDLTYQKRGNLTGFLEWRAGNQVRRYTWPERAGAPDVPEALRAAIEATRAAVQSARP